MSLSLYFNIAEIATNVGKFLKSPIISEKRDILKLILSDCKTEGKNIAFSIVKPFNELLKTPETDKWCRWQACARGQSHRANQRFSLRSLSFAKLRLALSPDLLMPPQVRLCNITIKKASAMGGFFNGAAGKNRTCDPVITNDVLYH